MKLSILLALIFRLLLFIAPQSSTSYDCVPGKPIRIDHWRGEYFNNRDLSGSPSMIRDDGPGEIDFDWKLDGPSKDCGINIDQFSVRWTRTVTFAGGAYRFFITSDDGVRLFIDGQEKYSNWVEQPGRVHAVDAAVAPGNHKITLEYFENYGSAVAKLRWERHPCISTVQPDHWKAEFFNNAELTGAPAVVRDDGDQELSFDNPTGGPATACGIGNKDYSVRWSRRATFGEGAYRFDISTTGGARLIVDGEVKFDQWRPQAPINSSLEIKLAPGNRRIVFEIRNTGRPAAVFLRWRPLPCLDQVADDRWRGEYFNDESMTGRPVMIRDDGDGQIDFNWGDASPGEACNVSRDNFSVRWTRNAALSRGLYRFVVAGNDGLRFYIDGQLKLDQWRRQSASFIVDAFLEAGRHELKLEYNDLGGKASVRLSWQPPPCVSEVPAENWRGEYFNNKNLSGRPIVVRDDGDGGLDFDWGLNAPRPDCFSGVDDFSARWTRNVGFATGTYRFTVTADDGVRLFIDGRKLIDQWRDQNAATYTIDVELSAGPHRIALEFYENMGSALVKLTWRVAPCTAVVASERWKGEYFNNAELSGKPALIRDDGDAQLNFDWGLKSPDSNCGIDPDNFSTRWTRTATFGEGVYRFTITADDGVRVFIDRRLKFERWIDQSATHTFDLPLTAGNHLITIEYFERRGSAALNAGWEQHPCFAMVASERWRGEYFNNSTFSGRPAMVRDEGSLFLNFDWANGSPNPACNLSRDDFAVRFSRRAILEAGTYLFTATADDGARLYVNGKKIIDQWRNQRPATFTAQIALPAGNHQIVFEYYENTGEAVAKLEWKKISR